MRQDLHLARFSDAAWIAWRKKIIAMNGVITLDVGPNLHHEPGKPIGGLGDAQMKQLRAIRPGLTLGQ